jgi:LAO/AO transport system kinase
MPTVSTCSSYTKEGIENVWKTISDYFELTKTNHFFEEKRLEQNQYWMMETINEQLKNHFYTHPEIINLLDKKKKAVSSNEISPFSAALELLSTYFK